MLRQMQAARTLAARQQPRLIRSVTASLSRPASSLASLDRFAPRHVGPRESDLEAMCHTVGVSSLDELMEKTVPANIRLNRDLDLGKYSEGLSESDALAELKRIASQNKVFKSFIGQGYHDCKTPTVILRNVLENPGWYTQYTPYQPEVSQGRLESLMNFQTMVADLTGMEMCNSSLLDEATAAAEAMAMIYGAASKKSKFFVDERVHPQTLAVLQTRAAGHGITVVTGDYASYAVPDDLCGALVQYPATDGSVHNYAGFADKLHKAGAKLAAAADLLSLTKLTPPGEWGADITVGCAQRFGVPFGYGGPHAGFLATSQVFARKMPGRIIGLSIDAQGKPAYRMAMQTREQHIRRDKATSNICTAQARSPDAPFFDTVRVSPPPGMTADEVIAAGHALGVNFRKLDDSSLCLACDETTSSADIALVWQAFNKGTAPPFSVDDALATAEPAAPIPSELARTSEFMTHPVFSSHQSEHQMLRYIFKLANKDISLVHCMIPLGSCTMKLNSTAEMMPITWPEINGIHPFAPATQAKGYAELIRSLEELLCEITGFPGMSLQPNSGASGEYSGLRTIRAYQARAHLKAKAEKHKDNLSALMVTYPSTHGVFEETIVDICNVVHENGGRGGGPGIGPIGVAAHLKPFLPSHPVVPMGGESSFGCVAAAPWGSASILPISWMYCVMMGSKGLKRATEVAILNANYMAARLNGHYKVLYTGKEGFCAHEFILDLREFKASAGVTEADVAKRLADYNFHAPTMSWPVAGTIMVEPTESEDKAELDRFCEAMISIRKEIAQIEQGLQPRDDNVLKNAPHTAAIVMADDWTRPYSRNAAAFPLPSLRSAKFWPTTSRVNDTYGDRNLVCSCPPLEVFVEDEDQMAQSA